MSRGVAFLRSLDVRDVQGVPVRDDTFLMLFNAHHQPVNFAIPGKKNVHWEVYLDTRHESGFPADSAEVSSGDELEVMERSVCVLRLAKGSQDDARSVAWKRSQKAEPVPPPVPPKPSPQKPKVPTPVGARASKTPERQARTTELKQ